jgi:hypothetical protein
MKYKQRPQVVYLPGDLILFLRARSLGRDALLRLRDSIIDR